MINQDLMQNSLGKSALYKTLVLLGKRSYTEKQIQQKLLKKGYPEDIVESVIEYCINMGYLNDWEYVRQWISTYNRLKPMGRKRILYELKNKGIEQDIINYILDESFSNDEEYQLAAGLIRRKVGHNLEIDKKTAKRFYQLLLRRGFSHEIAMRVLNNLKY